METIKDEWYAYIKKHGDEEVSFFEKIDTFVFKCTRHISDGFYLNGDMKLNITRLSYILHQNQREGAYLDFFHRTEKSVEVFYYRLTQNVDDLSESGMAHSKYFLYMYLYFLEQASKCDKFNENMDILALYIYALFIRIINIFNEKEHNFHINRHTWLTYLNEDMLTECDSHEIYLPCTIGILEHLKESKYIDLVNHNAMSSL